MRSVRIVSLLFAVLLTGLIGSRPAGADALLLANGDLLSGELQVTELMVMTAEGTVRIGRQEISQVTLGTASADTIDFRTGRTLSGLVDQATYAIRLPSGQTVAVHRAQAGVLQFSRR